MYNYDSNIATQHIAPHLLIKSFIQLEDSSHSFCTQIFVYKITFVQLSIGIFPSFEGGIIDIISTFEYFFCLLYLLKVDISQMVCLNDNLAEFFSTFFSLDVFGFKLLGVMLYFYMVHRTSVVPLC